MEYRASLPNLRVRVTGPERLVSQFLCRYPKEAEFARLENGHVALEFLVSEPLLAVLGRLGVKFEVLYDATARGRERAREVGVGNRFEAGRIPEGLGTRAAA